MQLWVRLEKLWRRWRGDYSVPREPPALRLSLAPRAPWPSWHPARGPKGQPMLQVMIELEGSNKTGRDIRITSVWLRDHPVEKASFTIRAAHGGGVAPDLPVPAHGRANIVLMFFVRGRRYGPGQAFSDVVVVEDDEGSQYRLKLAIRGR